MINIAGIEIKYEAFSDEHSLSVSERRILEILTSSSENYRYDYDNQLLFELNFRKSIIDSSIDLYGSNFSFKIFRKSRCNEDYWSRTGEGGFLLKDGIAPYDAIRDIYKHSSRYGTECSTAMVIIFYKALSSILPQELFNSLFSQIYLMNWQHLDNNLGVSSLKVVSDYLPGDCRYFKNPDVDPLTPEWQGENTIDLGDGRYYGHGVGIRSADSIIDILNRQRKEGSEVSAYLLHSVTRPDFRYLSDQYNKFTSMIPV